MADKGDSLTTMSRNLIHDYISQKQALGVEIALDKSQLIYAEDALKNLFKGRALSPGDELSLIGEQINSAIEKAQLLTSAGKEHIKQEYVSKIGSKVWEQITNYDSSFHSGNNFSNEILNSSSEKAVTFVHDSAQGFGADLAQRVADRGRNRAAESVVEKARDSWLESFLSVTGAAYAGEYGTKGRLKEFADKLRKRKALVREYRHAEDFNEGDSDLRYVELTEDMAIEKKPKEKVEPKTEPKPKKERVEKKIPDDQMFKYFGEKGIAEKFKLKPEEIRYKVRTPNTVKIFPSYEKMTRWFNSLSQKKKDWLIDQELNADEPAIKMDLPERLREFMSASPLSRQSFNAEVDGLIKNMFGFRETPISKHHEQTEDVFRGRIAEESDSESRDMKNLVEILAEEELEKKNNNSNQNAA